MHGNCCGDGCVSFWLGFTVLQTFYDKACDREIQKLTVRCRHAKNNGCKWIGTLHDEYFHYIACTFCDEKCPNCVSYMMCIELKNLVNVECFMKWIECSFCSELLPALHEEVCC